MKTILCVFLLGATFLFGADPITQQPEDRPTYAVVVQTGLGRIFKDDGGYKDTKIREGEIYFLEGVKGDFAVISRDGPLIFVPPAVLKVGSEEFAVNLSKEIRQSQQEEADRLQAQRDKAAVLNKLNQLQQSVNDQADRTRQLQAQQAEIDWQQRHPR